MYLFNIQELEADEIDVTKMLQKQDFIEKARKSHEKLKKMALKDLQKN